LLSELRSHLKTLGLGFGSPLYGVGDSRGPLTATAYIFAVVMTVLIVWLVTEIPVTGALKGPRSMQREAINRHK